LAFRAVPTPVSRVVPPARWSFPSLPLGPTAVCSSSGSAPSADACFVRRAAAVAPVRFRFVSVAAAGADGWLVVSSFSGFYLKFGPARPGPTGFRPGPARPVTFNQTSGPGPARPGPARPAGRPARSLLCSVTQ